MAVDIDLRAIAGDDGEFGRQGKCWVALFKPLDQPGHRPSRSAGVNLCFETGEVLSTITEEIQG